MRTGQLNEPVAIVGSACRFPGGANTKSSLWNLLKSPRDLSGQIKADRFDTDTFYHPDGSHHGTTNVQHAYLLEEDVRVFDAQFFNISPNEADSIDPQQRLLLEAVYEAMEAGGHSLEALKGSDTAVYAGTMTADYNDTLTRDLNSIPTYFATGTNRAIISNRVSYFFDWHGPSMTIDTACSSSLIAVHQGVKALRTGEARVAVAAGTQVILNPEMFIGESKLKMLSPRGKSRMWDEGADGYARGEGVAVVLLKLLSDAIADGDHIECIIRETGANQDGFSNGLTVPNPAAQESLIRQTYARAGLDIDNNPNDRPQFFEAHGTGTQAGDQREAAAIYETFGKNIDKSGATPLYVGSVKTLIGHLEGAAGLAGLLKGAAMIRAGYVAPNLHFDHLNPKVKPFYKGVVVPTQLTPWPTLPKGVPRRVSVNSFGFGGANAHAILEQYQPGTQYPAITAQETAASTSFSPFVFSALSEASLVGQLQSYSDHLKKNHESINAADLAWTLQSRRSQLPYKATVAASTLEQLATKIDGKLAELSAKAGSTIGVRSNIKGEPKILGVFTGQGAQWPAMGANLIRKSDFARKRIETLEQSLATLPVAHRPTWSLMEEMLAGDETSRIGEAALSQPLCLAVQVVLVDLLRAAGINFTAVVGHSSGEIGAAYAAGFLSDVDCIRVAYYRGLYAGVPAEGEAKKKGAMLAVGTSWEDAQDLCNLRAFKGKLAVAAHNSPASVTLSGDHDAVLHAKRVFDEEKKFARMLKVDMAYHSQHMTPSGIPYVKAMKECGVKVITDRPANAPQWFSSVSGSAEPLQPTEDIAHEYWRDNMCNAVRFFDACSNAVTAHEDLNLAFEVGPHPALKGPASQNIAEVRPNPIPYSGVLSRGKDDVEAFAEALGFAWVNMPKLVNWENFEKTVTGNSTRKPKLVVDLPRYKWNHARTYWSESRVSRKLRHRKTGPHEILGFMSPYANSHDLHWSNVLKPSEIPWLSGHQLQGQMVFPAAGYVAMALEASKSLAGDKSVEVFELLNLTIPRAVIFEEGDNNGVETVVALTAAQHFQDHATAEFACYSTPLLGAGSEQEMDLMASGSVKIIFGTGKPTALATTMAEDYNMMAFDQESFYGALTTLGYNYRGPFRTLSEIKRKLNSSKGLIDAYSSTNPDESSYLVHPSTLDVAFQSAFLALSAPGDGRLWSLSVPTEIKAIRVNPHVCAAQPLTNAKVPVCATLDPEATSFSANIDMFGEDGQNAMIQIEDLGMKPFAPASKKDDRIMYTNTKLSPYLPDGAAVLDKSRPSVSEVELAAVCERIAYFYFRKWKTVLGDANWATNETQHPRWAHYLTWVDEMLRKASRGQHPTLRKEWSQDTDEEIQALVNKYSSQSIDVKLLHAVGENLPAAVRGDTGSLKETLPLATVEDWYQNALGFQQYHSFLAQMVKQVTYRYPHSRILEIGARAGGATKSILEEIGNTYSSYTYTDVSEDHFLQAKEQLKAHKDKMIFKKYDAEKSPASQGYEPHSYDIIIASNVLFLDDAEFVQKTLENTRKLLRPGGYLIWMGLTGQAPVRYHSILGSVSGWRSGANDGKKLSPPMTPSTWNLSLRRAGFSGVDTITPEVSGAVWPMSVIASQAVDDKIKFLQKPLSTPAASAIKIESLVILGNQTLKTSQLGEELSDILGRFCGEITVLEGLPTEEDSYNLNPTSTFINLVDLDTPIFDRTSDETMDALKRMLELSKSVTWITEGGQMEQPYHMASIAFLRSLRMEEIHLNINQIDIASLQEQSGQAKLIAEYILRQVALDEWEAPPSALATPLHRQYPFIWSVETEVYLDINNKLQIPRIVVNNEQNDRINSSRRAITRAVPAAQSSVSVVTPSAAAPAQVLEQMRARNSRDDAGGKSLVRLASSTLLPLCVATDTFLYLGIGQSKTDNSQLEAVLSTTNASEVKPLVRVALASSTVDTDSQLVAIASELVAENVIANVSADSRVLVHASAADGPLAAALSRRGVAKSVKFTFSCETETSDQETTRSWIKINGRAPAYALRKRVRTVQPTHFVDLTVASGKKGLGVRIAQNLPAACLQLDASTLFRYGSTSQPHSAIAGDVQARLAEAMASATPVTSQKSVVPLKAIRTLADKTVLSGIHWPQDGDVEVEVREVDARGLFSRGKSYLLVGLSGQMGQSFAEWMIQNGAGCVILTSRRPNVDQRWLDSLEGSGGYVKVMAMDVMDMSRVEAVVKEIRTTCLPIGGVINGAMVLVDTLFSRMSGEGMRRVLGPKIDGSKNLDDAFYDDDLDFFVALSSATCLVGNAGQTNYAAGNGYLYGLARQRRRRGLAASVLDIGQVSGIGYIESASPIVREQLTRYKLVKISETDLRQTLAETILVGYPDYENDQLDVPAAVVTTGVREIADDETDIKGPWFINPIFSHVITESASADAMGGAGGADGKSSLPVGQRLPKAANKEESLEILRDGFTATLRTMLQLGADHVIDRDAPLMELGIDSLVAVEVRSWFLKALKVDIPVLKIIGGASLAEICETAFGKLPVELQPAGPGAVAAAAAPAAKGAAAAKPAAPAATTASKSAAPAVAARPKPVHVAKFDPKFGKDKAASSDSDSQSASDDSSDAPLETPATGISLSGATTPALEKTYFDQKESAPTTKAKPAVPAPAARRFLKSEQISLPQSRFWFLRHLLEDQTTPNVTFSFLMAGDMRVGDLEKAIRVLTIRHEALRTCFVGHETNPGEAYQKVMPSSLLRLERKNVGSVEDVTAEYKQLQKHVFDLEAGDTMKMILCKLSPTSHYVVISYHHIIMDGVSFNIFLSDLEKSYQGIPLGPVPRQYPDFSAAQRRALESGEMSEELKYWQTVFPDGEQPPVLPLLPMARTSSRVAMNGFDTWQVGKHLDARIFEQVKVVAKAARSTPFHLHLAAFKAMLFALSPECKDLTIGIADAARNESDIQGSIGFFLNLLTLRFKRDGNQSFHNAISEAREVVHGALSSSRLPFDILLTELKIARSSLHAPFFQAFLDYRLGQETVPWADLDMTYHHVHPGRTAYDITLDIMDSRDASYVMIRVQKSLYDLTAANLLLETYTQFLDAVTKDASMALQETPMFGESQLVDAVKVGRGLEMVSDWPETLPHRIDQIALDNKDKVALIDGADKELTYAQMSDRIQAMAESLQTAGVTTGSRVLVFQQPTVDWTCSMLAIMRLGAVYVPLDLRNPITRLASVAKDCEATAVLAHDATMIDAPKLDIGAIINVSHLGDKPLAPIANLAKANSPAAILYTSGSTGTPKGIQVTHAGLRNEIEGYTKSQGLGAERVLQQSAMTFNHSSDQMYTGLVNGGTVIVVPVEKRGDPLEISKIMVNQSITYTKATPAEYLLWLQYGSDTLKDASNWKFAYGGGEQLTTTVTEEFTALSLKNLRFFNSYGPTEISISSHKMEMPYTDKKAMLDMGRVPCGFSLPNYHTYIVDEKLKPVPVGMPGEIYIGGAGVSNGYLNNEKLTDYHFVHNPFATANDIANGWTRMYRTGDIGYLREDGAMVFKSRLAGDSQVKIRGIRIELSDIESSIIASSHGVIREAVVTLRENDVLVAHVIFAQTYEDDAESKDRFLERLLSKLPLPQYMIPVIAIPIGRFPVSNHSKVDRKAVQAMPLPVREGAGEDAGADEELSETMMQLREVWRAVLGSHTGLLFDMTPRTNFFLVGGNSLLVIRLQAQIRATFNLIVPLVKLLSANTLGEMAQVVEEESASAGAQSDIDWDLETKPPKVSDFVPKVSKTKKKDNDEKTLLVTGGTGFTAYHLLTKLAARDDIKTIHCVALRDKTRDLEPITHPKVIYHLGDLSTPLMGLDKDIFRELAIDVDVIIHIAGLRGYFDNYHLLRSSNVQPTRELVKLAAPRKLPIHFISSAGVLPREIADCDDPAESASAFVPAADGNDGYISSKWASERILERSAERLKVPSSIYRFVAGSSATTDLAAKQAFLSQLGSLVGASGTIPDMKGWTGHVSFSPVEEVSQWLYEAIATGSSSNEKKEKLRYAHYDSPIYLDVNEIRDVLEKERCEGLGQMPLLKWFGKIKAFGFSYLLTTHDTAVDASGTGTGIISTRR